MGNKLTNILNIEKPIIQASMHTMTNAELVAAVSEAGGLGVLGFNAGYKPTDAVTGASENADSDMDDKGILRSGTAVKLFEEQVKKVKKLTSKPFAAALFSETEDPKDDEEMYKELQIMIQEKVPVVLFAGKKISQGWVDAFHKNNIKIIYRAMTPTAKNTKEVVKKGVDAIIATGFDEGGTIPEKVVGTFSIVPLVADAAGDVPVIAAGGIGDARTVRAAFDLGAQGVYVGTSFLASKEAPIADNIKQMMIDSDADDLLMFRYFMKFYRSLPGELPNKLVQMDEEGKSREEIFAAGHGAKGMLSGMVEGDLSNGIASFGTGIGLVHEIKPAAEIVEDLYKGVPDSVK